MTDGRTSRLGQKWQKQPIASNTAVQGATKTMNTESVEFLLSSCCIGALDSAILSCSLKTRHDNILKTTCLVSSRCEITVVRVEAPTLMKTIGPMLTQRK